MKKFFLKVLFFSLLFIINIAACIVIDPFNVFHYKNIRDNGVTPNERYIKMRYILDNPAKFNSYLFGSSRVRGINVESITQLHYYNMTYAKGISKEHFVNLAVMVNNDIIPNTVLVGVDDIDCYNNPEYNSKNLPYLLYPKEGLQNNLAFFVKYFNPVVLKSTPTIISHKRNDAIVRKQFYENGVVWPTGPYPRLDWENAVGSSKPFNYGIDNAIKDIQSIIDLCNQHNIKLIIFTNPLHELTYQQAVEYGYIDFLARLSEITNFYNFSGINDVTTNNDYYLETHHYKLTAGDLIIDTIFNNKTDSKLLSQGFGWYVTNENKAAFINLLRSQLTNQP